MYQPFHINEINCIFCLITVKAGLGTLFTVHFAITMRIIKATQVYQPNKTGMGMNH